MLATSQGSITAMDVSARRLNALRSSADAAGVGRMVTTVAADLRQYALDMPADAPGFDKVLLDAPCSGDCSLGMGVTRQSGRKVDEHSTS